MPNNSQSKMTTDLMDARARYNLLSDETERLLIYASGLVNATECQCHTLSAEDQPCARCMLQHQVKKMAKPGSPLAANTWITGDLNRDSVTMSNKMAENARARTW